MTEALIAADNSRVALAIWLSVPFERDELDVLCWLELSVESAGL